MVVVSCSTADYATQRSATPRSPCATVAVLGSYELFTYITTYMAGLPALIESFRAKNDQLWKAPSLRGMLPCLAVQLGSQREIEALYRLLERGDCLCDERVSFCGSLEEAAACSEPSMIQWLLRQPRLQRYRSPRLLDVAISSGSLEVAQWLYASNSDLCGELSSHAVDCSAQASRLELFEWIHHHRLARFTPAAVVFAVESGNVQALRVLHEDYALSCRSEDVPVSVNEAGVVFAVVHGMIADPFRLIEKVYEGGGRSIAATLVRELHDNAPPVQDRDALTATASMVGDLRLLHGLVASADCHTLQRAMAVAARYGHQHVLDFIKSSRSVGISASVFNTAVRYNHHELVKHFVEQDPACCPDTALHLAAAQGSTEIVQFLALDTHAGCLHHARRLALRTPSTHDVVAFLSSLIDPSVRFCEPKLHRQGAASTTTRRCQLRTKASRWSRTKSHLWPRSKLLPSH